LFNRKVSGKGAVGIQQKSELQNFHNHFLTLREIYVKILKLVLLVPFFVSFLGKQKRKDGIL
jgi:hypothetical protein